MASGTKSRTKLGRTSSRSRPKRAPAKRRGPSRPPRPATPSERVTLDALTNLQEEFDEAIHHVQASDDSATWAVGAALPISPDWLLPGSVGWVWNIDGETGTRDTTDELGTVFIVTIPGPRTAKGKAQPAMVFTPLGPRNPVAFEPTRRSRFVVIGATAVSAAASAKVRLIAGAARREFEQDD